MPGPLNGVKILTAENRELDVFAGMFEKEGAIVLRRPLLRILDLEDRKEADNWIDAFIGGSCEDLILLTGEGLRRLLALSEFGARRDAFCVALARVRTIVRGPKPSRALHEIGLAPKLSAPSPTSEGVIEALAGEDLRGRRIGLQLYPGPGGARLSDWLRGRGAYLFPVTPYRYATQMETSQVAETIADLSAGRIDIVAFTSGPQIDRLVAVACDLGREEELRTGLARTFVASIGPVVERKLRAMGVQPFAQPSNNFHMKPLVRSIVAAYMKARA